MRCVCISCFNSYSMWMECVIAYFRKKGYRVTYITSDYDHIQKKHIKARRKGTIHIHVPGYKNNISPGRLISHVVFSWKTGKILEKLKPDLVYCIFPPNTLVKNCARYRTANKHAKLIFDCHDTWPESFPYKKYQKLLRMPFDKWKNLRDNYIEAADKLVCVSKECRDFFTGKNIKIPVEVLKPAANRTQIPDYQFQPEKEIAFCYLGNVNHITDISLVKSLLQILSVSRKSSVHIIGQGQNLDRMIKELQMPGVRIICYGTVFDERKKAEIIAQCVFGLNVPRESIHSTRSLKSIEYMRFGLPILNAGSGENFDIVKNKNTGLNVNRSNIRQTAEDILNIDSRMLYQMSENSIQCYQESFIGQDLHAILKI